MSKKQKTDARRLGAFSDACYGMAKTMLGGGALSLAIKAMLAPVFSGLHVAVGAMVFGLALFFLLLGLLAEDD